jgi:hypothetical protein
VFFHRLLLLCLPLLLCPGAQLPPLLSLPLSWLLSLLLFAAACAAMLSSS